MKKIYSKSPVRIGLIGGGTDLPAFCDNETGHIVNCAISLYNHVYISSNEAQEFSLEILNKNTNDHIIISDLEKTSVPPFLTFASQALKYICETYQIIPNKKIKISMESDIEGGSGLGGSSSMMVAIVAGLDHLFNIGLSRHEIAETSFIIERKIIGIDGGSQDFYASAFGGINHMHFKKSNIVLINQINLENKTLLELESSILLFYTGIRREAKIIEKEKGELLSEESRFRKMSELSKLSKNSVKCLLNESSIVKFGHFINLSWKLKKETSSKVSSKLIEEILMIGNNHGVYGGKISGAGSGGYGFFLMSPSKKWELKQTLKTKSIEAKNINIDFNGVTTIEHEY